MSARVCRWAGGWLTAAPLRGAPHPLTPPPEHPSPPHPTHADPEDPLRVTDATRRLGLVVCRGTSVMLVMPTAGTEEIANPFLAQE